MSPSPVARVALLGAGGIILATAPLLAWSYVASFPSGGDGIDFLSLWSETVAADVAMTGCAVLTVLLAVVVLVRPAFTVALVAIAAAAAFSGAAWAGEYFGDGPDGSNVFDLPGPYVAVGGALFWAAGTAATLRQAPALPLRHGRVSAVGRGVLLLAGVATPVLIVAAGSGGVSLYERLDVIDIVLTALAAVAATTALAAHRHRLLPWAAVIAGGGLAGLAYATGLELLLVEQDFLRQTDGAGVALAFVVAPLASIGTVLLGAALDDG